VTNDNADLHQGLGVPSLPYGHIYQPSVGLVEELKISRRHFRGFARMVRWYDKGLCDLEERTETVGGGEENDVRGLVELKHLA